MPGQTMVQLEADYSGIDNSINFKMANPSPVDKTGVFVASYLQSLTKAICAGFEYAYQHPTADIAESQMSFVGRYTGKDFVVTTNLAQLGIVQASYYHKVSEKYELGAEVQVMSTKERRDAVCTLGGKVNFVQAVFRGQIDTTGRVSAVLEQRLGPSFSVFMTGDIDHMKGQSRFGMGVQLEN
jgi:mitochondrial import receptor subunit TOM40